MGACASSSPLLPPLPTPLSLANLLYFMGSLEKLLNRTTHQRTGGSSIREHEPVADLVRAIDEGCEI